jgi:hypothetical protein
VDIRLSHTPFVCCAASPHKTKGEYWLLWGVTSDESEDDEDSDDMNDDGNYSMTPQAKAVILFDALLKRQGARLAREESFGDWLFSGFMPKLTKTMRQNANTAKAVADARVYTQLSRSEKISFVYDFCDPTRTFASLTYVGDAARHPLRQNISNEEFIRTYGLAKTLSFQAATERAAPDHNYWGDLYDA